MQVLSTGAVVVDLPGVRDANAARGAVAEKYMKSCNAVWIVADITRAVDNRTAKVRDLSLPHRMTRNGLPYCLLLKHSSSQQCIYLTSREDA